MVCRWCFQRYMQCMHKRISAPLTGDDFHNNSAGFEDHPSPPAVWKPPHKPLEVRTIGLTVDIPNNDRTIAHELLGKAICEVPFRFALCIPFTVNSSCRPPGVNHSHPWLPRKLKPANVDCPHRHAFGNTRPKVPEKKRSGIRLFFDFAHGPSGRCCTSSIRSFGTASLFTAQTTQLQLLLRASKIS